MIVLVSEYDCDSNTYITIYSVISKTAIKIKAAINL